MLPANPPAPGEELQPSSAKPKKSFGCLAVAILFGFMALFGGGGVVAVLLLISTMMRDSDAYRMAMQTVQDSPCVVQRLGSPIKSGWFVGGATRTVGTEGYEDLNFSVSGPKNSGRLHVVANEMEGIWSIQVLSVTVGDERIRVLPVPSSCN